MFKRSLILSIVGCVLLAWLGMQFVRAITKRITQNLRNTARNKPLNRRQRPHRWLAKSFAAQLVQRRRLLKLPLTAPVHRNYWTNFRGPNRDGKYEETSVSTTWPAKVCLCSGNNLSASDTPLSLSLTARHTRSNRDEVRKLSRPTT